MDVNKITGAIISVVVVVIMIAMVMIPVVDDISEPKATYAWDTETTAISAVGVTFPEGDNSARLTLVDTYVDGTVVIGSYTISTDASELSWDVALTTDTATVLETYDSAVIDIAFDNAGDRLWVNGDYYADTATVAGFTLSSATTTVGTTYYSGTAVFSELDDMYTTLFGVVVIVCIVGVVMVAVRYFLSSKFE